jgi:hypothetical protein
MTICFLCSTRGIARTKTFARARPPVKDYFAVGVDYFGAGREGGHGLTINGWLRTF